MNPELTQPEDRVARAGRDERPPSIDIPSYYVDQAAIHAQPFTVHLVLGMTTPDGTILPQVHLTMNPTFAAFLKNALTELDGVYFSANGPAPSDARELNPAEEAGP